MDLTPLEVVHRLIDSVASSEVEARLAKTLKSKHARALPYAANSQTPLSFLWSIHSTVQEWVSTEESKLAYHHLYPMGYITPGLLEALECRELLTKTFHAFYESERTTQSLDPKQ